MSGRWATGVLCGGLWLAGFGCGANAPASGLACGPGTHEEGRLCLPDAPRSEDDSADAGTTPDAGTDSDAGAGAIVHDGDPCPSMHDACSGNEPFLCHLVPGTAQYGTLSPDGRSCDALGGTCVVEGGRAYCTGGGYTACDPHTDRQHCVDDRILADCSGAGWYGIDCALTRTPEGVPYACKTVQMSDRDGICAPPP